MISRIDSKALPNFVSTPNHGFYPQPCTYRALMSLTARSPCTFDVFGVEPDSIRSPLLEL